MDATLVASAEDAFTTTLQPSTPGRTFSQEFASQKLMKEMHILDMPARNLPAAWDICVKAANAAKIAVEDEIANGYNAHVGAAAIFVVVSMLILIADGAHWQNI